MCGISCIVNQEKKVSMPTLSSMTLSLTHRGPDAQKWRLLDKGKIGIGNTRLSLVDLSSNGNQPMEKHGLTISFNGEIYNYQEIRALLEGVGFTFHTTSDTEVLLSAIFHWGLEKSLELCNGCFAFVLFDSVQKKLFAVRDPIGEKYIAYTYASNGDIVFASEIKALLKHPFVKAKPNVQRCISLLYMSMHAQQQETFFENIFYIPPGHYMTIDMEKKTKPRLHPYWTIDAISQQKYTKKDLPDLETHFLDLLSDSVRLRMRADTHIGSILSGGLDSSFITALAAHTTSYPISCFTTGYKGIQNDDLFYARLLAKKEHMRLTEIQPAYVPSREEIFEITRHFEEPIITKVYYSMYQNYKKVQSKNIKGVINGQGADEFWLGYIHADPLYGLPKKMYAFDAFTKYWFEKAHCTPYLAPSMKKRVIASIVGVLQQNYHLASENLFSLQELSIKTHLAAILHVEDALSMAHGVEVRLPYLDKRLMAFALSIPPHLKVADKREKYINRIAAKGILPTKLISRKKQGFPIPPLTYDTSFESLFSQEELFSSEILRSIFSKNALENMATKLHPATRWYLYAIAIMEKTFFR